MNETEIDDGDIIARGMPKLAQGKLSKPKWLAARWPNRTIGLTE